MEKESNYQIEEAVGREPVGIKMTEDQAYYLHQYIDPEVDRLIENMELERVRRELSDEYQRRTINKL